MRLAYRSRGISRRERRERQPDAALDQAHLGDRPLDRDRIRLDEELAVQPEQPEVELARALHVARKRRRAHLVHQSRRHVGGDRDHAVAAEQDQREAGGVVAAVDREVLRRALRQGRMPRSMFAVASLMPMMFGTCASRSTVSFGMSATVRPGTLYRIIGMSTASAIVRKWRYRPSCVGLVVVRHDRQAGGRAGALRRLGELDRLRGRVRAGARDDRHAARGVRDGDVDQLLVLVEVDRRRLARGAHDHDAVGAFGDVPVDEGLEARDVETAILEHRGDDGDQAAGDHGLKPLDGMADFSRILGLRRSLLPDRNIAGVPRSAQTVA